jgi:mono/diheme cytochrome c family protein
MPAFDVRLDPRDIDDLVAYYASVNDRMELPDAARPGRELAVSLGCFNCHGRDGAGGVQNPGSLKGYVPGWLGSDFEELVRDESELREWIQKGGIQRLAENPAARAFLERQTVQMPPFQTLLDPEKLDHLVIYIQSLRSRREPR